MPTNSVTNADQLPPPESRSSTKNQPTKTAIDAMNGNLKRRMSSSATPSTSSSSTSRENENELSEAPLDSHPNQDHSAPMNSAHAITAANANTPAASQRSRRFSPSAIR